MLRKILLGLLLLAPLAAYPFLRGSAPYNDYIPPTPANQILTDDERLALGCLAIMPGTTFPVGLPWEPLRRIGERSKAIEVIAQKSQTLDDLAKHDPVAFLEECVKRYHQEVHGYRVMFIKWENVNGKKEKILCHFREKPFSVFMDWKEGRGKAARTLYVEGENDGDLLARGVLLGREIGGDFGIVQRATDDPDAMRTSRFTIKTFGILTGLKNTYEAMHDAKKKGTLHVRYEGLHPLPQVGDRLCYKFVRTPYDPSDWETDLDKKEKLNELTFYIDKATLLQVGSVLMDVDGKMIAEYFFRDIELNPTFDADQFTRKKL